jgi:hypothetical protein
VADAADIVDAWPERTDPMRALLVTRLRAIDVADTARDLWRWGAGMAGLRPVWPR